VIEGLYASELVDEMLRLMSDGAGWPSTLFRQSTIALMEELAEAGVQASRGVLSASSFNDLKSQVREQLLLDPGLGPIQARGPLISQVPRDYNEFVPSSFKHKAWTFAIPSLKNAYMRNWTDELSRADYAYKAGDAVRPPVSASSSAEFLASHLLYLGLSSSYLSKWFNYRAKHDATPYTLADITRDLQDLVTNGFRPVQIMIILARPAQSKVQSMQGWLDATSVKQWFVDNRLQGPGKIHGGILYESAQWDLDGALLNVAKAVHRLQKRAILKTGRAPEFHGAAWIAGVSGPRRLPAISQLGGRALAPGYELGDPQVEAPISNDRLEVAVEFLLAGLSEPGPSAAGTLWAALEALLAAPGDPDRIQVVDRASDIALVAFVRASIQMALGLLFSRCPEDGLTQRLRDLDLRDRLTQFEEALRRDEHQTLSHHSTRVALSHTKQLFDEGNLRLRREEFRQNLRGLYRQRNLILHGGITDGPLLGGILRASTPLVTAVINRYARAIHDGLVDPHIFAYEMLVRLEGYLNDPRTIVAELW
jgi:hypothetical protein